MNYDFDPEQQELREQLRALIDEHMPADYPSIFVEESWPVEASDAFCQVLGSMGLLTMSWPEQYGGSEASIWSQVVLREEMWSHNEPRGGQYMGLNWVGPAIMKHGTDAQKSKHLPPIARGDVTWCQGFSEPGSGSDLRSLSMRAAKVPGGFLLSGQKVWTSYASHASWCFLAARTGEASTTNAGITVFLVPMDRTGIEVRAIPTQILGPRHFHELFFSDVMVADDEVLGAVGEGWSVMTGGLAAERVGIARYARARRLLDIAYDLCRDRWLDVPGGLRARVVDAYIHSLAATLLNYRAYAGLAKGENSKVAVPVARIAMTLHDQEVAAVTMDLLGADGLLSHSDSDAPAFGMFEHHWRYAQASTVAAGSLEIQRNAVARASTDRRSDGEA
jgi:alkylation response protein AidB-like acyl-CoA dehydrogenase